MTQTATIRTRPNYLAAGHRVEIDGRTVTVVRTTNPAPKRVRVTFTVGGVSDTVTLRTSDVLTRLV